MRGLKPGVMLLAAAVALIAASCSPTPESSSSPPASESAATPEPTEVAEAPSTEPAPVEAPAAPIEAPAPATGYEPPPSPEPTPYGPTYDTAPGAGVPMAPGSFEPAGGSAPPPPPPPMANGMGAPPPNYGPPMHDPAPSAPSAMPPAAAGDPPFRNGHSGAKVLSYFQQSRTQIDTKRAFGFVLMPKAAVTAEDQRAQKDFCTTVLATMDFMSPGAVSASAPRDVLATYWPVVGSRESYEIKQAFAERNCDDLIAWYDYRLARTLAARAGVAELSGPLLITWPSSGAEGETARDPLIVDFSKANHERAAKALQYWFRQVKARPDLWTSRIREGTIRAELADAVNDTAGVVLAVMSGKWDSLTVVASANATPL
jgi:hypothetical protein